jgi:hypothetical protein
MIRRNCSFKILCLKPGKYKNIREVKRNVYFTQNIASAVLHQKKGFLNVLKAEFKNPKKKFPIP